MSDNSNDGMSGNFGAMPPAQNYSAPQNGMGTAALVLGIVGIACLPIISVLAIIFGNIGMKRAATGQANNGGMAKAGFILGIIGLALLAVYAIFWIAAVSSSSGY